MTDMESWLGTDYSKSGLGLIRRVGWGLTSKSDLGLIRRVGWGLTSKSDLGLIRRVGWGLTIANLAYD
jgi:hypothetical protein